jgi:hypothetical protein
MVKLDCGPGKLQANALAETRTLECIMYPGVPNTTAVKQATDQNYGAFNTQFVKKSKAIGRRQNSGRSTYK